MALNKSEPIGCQDSDEPPCACAVCQFPDMDDDYAPGERAFLCEAKPSLAEPNMSNIPVLEPPSNAITGHNLYILPSGEVCCTRVEYVKYTDDQKNFLLAAYEECENVGKRDQDPTRINLILKRLTYIGYRNQIITRAKVVGWFSNERSRRRKDELKQQENGGRLYKPRRIRYNRF